MAKALEYLLSQPLLCTVEAAEVAASIVSREGTFEAVEAVPATKVESGYGMSMRNGVAIIPVAGPIYGASDPMTRMAISYCGGAHVADMAKDIKAAADDPFCRAILLNVNSPGGQVSGVGELAGMIREANRSKPVCAYVSHEAASAAYWLASQAGEIVCAETGMVGSIGVVTGWTKKAPKAGEKTYEFVSTQSPMKRPDYDTPEGKASVQKRIDEIAAIFVGHVAAGRGVTPESVLSDFGKGDMLTARAAVDAGMADAVGDFESTLARLARGERLPAKARKTAPRSVPIGTAAPKIKGTTMNVGALLARLIKSDPDAAAKAISESEEVISAKEAAGWEAFAAYAAKASDPAETSNREHERKTEDQIRAEVEAKVKADNAAAMRTFYAEQASSWFDGMVAAGKALPATKARDCALYVDAAANDRAAGPITFESAPGSPETVTRLFAFVSGFAAREDHGKTSQAIPQGDATKVTAALRAKGLTALATDLDPLDEDKAAERARTRRELLSATPVGQQILADEAKAGK